MKRLVLGVLVGLAMAIIGGCGGGSETPAEVVKEVGLYAGEYKGSIASDSAQSFTVVADSNDIVTGTYTVAGGNYTLQGSMSGAILSATGNNGDVWAGEVTNGILFVIVKNAAGNKTGKGTLTKNTSTATLPTTDVATTGAVPKILFTNSMVAGKTMTIYFKSSSRIYVFDPTGNKVKSGDLTGTWAINPSGTLTISFLQPSDVITLTVNSNVGNSYSYNYVNATTPTVSEGPYLFLLQ